MPQIPPERAQELANQLTPYGSQKQGYLLFMTPYARNMYENIPSNYDRRQVIIRLNSLSARPRPLDALVKKGATDHYVVPAGEYEIEYRVHSGQLHIYQIGLNPNTAKRRARQEKPGLYHVKYEPGKQAWQSTRVPASEIKTRHAAVNGMNNDLAKAIWLMGDHLSKQYNNDNVQEYTLYHNPSAGGGRDFLECLTDKLGMTSNVAEGLSKVLVKSQSQEQSIKWVAHSQGGIIFTEAVRYYLNGMSSVGAAGRFGKNKDGLDKHSVCFHAGGNNIKRSEMLCKRAGITMYPPRYNPYDIVPQLAGGNAMTQLDFVGAIGSVIYANHVFGGSSNQSPHTTAHVGLTEWYNEMLYSPGKGLGPIQKRFSAIEPGLRRGQQRVQTMAKRTGVDKAVNAASLAIGITAETAGGAIKATVNYLK